MCQSQSMVNMASGHPMPWESKQVMGNHPPRTEYRSLMDMTWLGATKIWGPPGHQYHDALWCWWMWLSQSGEKKTNSLAQIPHFSISHRPYHGCYIMVYPVKSLAQKGNKKKQTALLRNLGQALKSGLPCSLKGFVWDIHQRRAETNQLNTPEFCAFWSLWEVVFFSEGIHRLKLYVCSKSGGYRQITSLWTT